MQVLRARDVFLDKLVFLIAYVSSACRVYNKLNERGR